MSIKLTIEGDDKDELLTAAKGVVEMLEGEAVEEETEAEEEESEEESGEEESEDEESADEDDNSELLGKIRKKVAAMIKTDDGPAKVKSVLAKFKAKKLDQVPSAKLPAVAKALGVKA